MDANTLTDERKKTGTQYHATGRTVISNGGKSMTVNIKGASVDGKTFNYVMVYDKQ